MCFIINKINHGERGINVKIGDTVQLKEPNQGRRYLGKIIKIHNGLVRVGLPNGLYAELPEPLWGLAENNANEQYQNN